MNAFENAPNLVAGGNYCPLRPAGFVGTARTAAVTAIASKADVYAQPSTVEGSASSGATDTFVFGTERARQVGVSFMGVGADNATGTATIWGWYPIEWVKAFSGNLKAPVKWVANPLCTISFLLGSRTVQDVANDPLSLTVNGSTWRYVDSITIVADYTYAATAAVLRHGLNAWASLYIDPCNAPLMEVEAICGTATKLMPWYARV